MKMITITTTGGGTNKQTRPLSQDADTIISVDGIDLARVKISASGRVARIDVAGQAVYSERAELAVAPVDPVPGIDTFTVQIKPTASEPATRLLVFTWTGTCLPSGKREVNTVLRFDPLFAARATQEVGYRFNEFIGPVSRASWDRSGR